MKRRWSPRDEDGQALVVVALAMVVLMGGLALSVDWGYSMLTRRSAQNQADAATLAAGRFLASTYVGGLDPFEATQEQVWCEARRVRDANMPSTPTTTTPTINVEYSDDGLTWSPPIPPVADCIAPGTTPVPPNTVYVRVRTTATYQSLFAVITLQSTLDVAAMARAKLTASAGCIGAGCAALLGLRPLSIPAVEIPGTGVSGALTKPNVAIWPLAVHYKAAVAELAAAGPPCGQYCDRSALGRSPVTLWPRPDGPYGASNTFTGLVSFAHFSPRAGSELPSGSETIHQLITETDYTGTDDNLPHGQGPSPDGLMPNADPGAGVCGGDPDWDTNGDRDLSRAASCDVPNWFAWGFRGSIGIGTDWDPSASWRNFERDPGNVDVPEALSGGRSSCDPAFIPLARPSCEGTPSLIGDWIETVPGDLTVVMADQMRSFIARYGRVVPNSGSLGKAVVIHLLLWDCAEEFDNAEPDPDERWSLMVPSGGTPGECAELEQSTPSVGRVHIVSAVPVTIYEGLIDTIPPRVRSVKAYWGDVFGDAGVCAFDPAPAGCDLNPVINSAFLVPDE